MTTIRLLLLAVACALAAPPVAAQNAAPHVYAISNPSVPKAYLNRALLRSVFTLRARFWPDGDPIKIFVLDDSHSLHRAFCQNVLGTYPYVLQRAWNRSLYTGSGLVPVRVSSVEEMIRSVMNTPGAVGYAPSPLPDASRQHDEAHALNTIAKPKS